MKELWEEACRYGRPFLYKSENGKFNCWIEFNTIKHVELKAKHEGYKDTPEESLKAAIAKAREIIEAIAGMKVPVAPSTQTVSVRALDKLKGLYLK